jgi:serine/threonine protein kinase/WD40 repeat protein
MSEPTPIEPVEPTRYDTSPPAPPLPNAAGAVEFDPLATLAAESRDAPAPPVEAVPGYEILKELGRGGMGVVYQARQTKLNRIVALKMILSGGHAGLAELARFRTEAEAIARLQHPGIVAIHEIGEHQGKPYFSLEYCAGGSLDRKLAGTPLDPTEAARLVQTLAEAMQAAHAANVIHRDLKPANVLLVSDELVSGEWSPSPGVATPGLTTHYSPLTTHQPKITDFGLAKKLDEAGQTITGAVIGTPSYMAPEQAEGKKSIGPAADIYSLGAILYECLTGRPPFKAATTLDTLGQVVSAEPVSLRQLNANVPVDLETICHKCLAKEPARRYPSARVLADDLGRFLAGQPVLARPVSRIGRGVRWCRRNPAVAALSIVVGLLLLAAAVVGPVIAVRQSSLRREADEQRTLAEVRADELDTERQRAESNADEAAAQARAARRALYAARQQIALNAWHENRTDRMAEVLQQQKPAPGESDLRGFEWWYLDRLSRSPGARWQSSGQMVNGVAISGDHRTAITVGFDARATAWDVATGKRKWDTADGFRWSINAAAIAPDGKTVALAGHLGQLQLWSIDGKPGMKLPGHRAQVFGVAFSPDGRTLASASADVTVRLWDVATGQKKGVLGNEPDAGPRRPGPQVRPVANPAESVGHTNMVWQVAWSPDGKRLASCSSDGSVKVWSIPERKLLHTLVGQAGIIVGVAWSPDGRQIASVSRPPIGPGGGEIRLWNPDTGRADATFRPSSGGLHAIAFTPDGLYLVTGGEDRTVRAWRKDGRTAAEHRGFRDEVIGLAVDGTGRWAVAGTRSGEIVAFALDVVPGKQSLTVTNGSRLAVSRDGRLAVYCDGAVSWHDPKTLAETAVWPVVRVPPPPKGEQLFSTASAFALRADGQSAHGANTAPGRSGFTGPGTVVWRDAAGKVRHVLAGHPGPIAAMAFLPDDRLASADETGTVKIWNGADGKAQTLQLWAGPIRFLAATHDGGLWAGGAPWASGVNKQKSQGETTKEGRLARIENDRVAWQSTTASVPSAGDVSSDGRTIVVGHQGGELVWLDARTGKEIRRQSSATGAVVSVRFSPDEPRVAVARSNGAVRLLDAISGEELLDLESSTRPVADLAFFPGSRRLAACIPGVLSPGILVAWDGRPEGDPSTLPTPDAAWHKDQLAIASGQKERRFGRPVKDVFAMRYHLQRLDALEPDKVEWPRTLLALDQDAGDYRAAEAQLAGILKRWPNDAAMWYDLGNARRELGDDKGAEAAFRNCIALDETMPEAHCNLGHLLGRQGRFAEAVKLIARGHELGMARKKAGKQWPYSSGAWLARYQRLGDLARRYAERKEFTDVPAVDRADLVEVLMLVKRPLAAVQFAAPKPDASPGPTVIGAALRCAEGIGDASALSAEDRSAWRVKALAWLRLDLESFRSADPSRRSGMCAAMRSHPYLAISQGERTAGWPVTDREAWQKFWAEVKTMGEGK